MRSFRSFQFRDGTPDVLPATSTASCPRVGFLGRNSHLRHFAGPNPNHTPHPHGTEWLAGARCGALCRQSTSAGRNQITCRMLRILILAAAQARPRRGHRKFESRHRAARGGVGRSRDGGTWRSRRRSSARRALSDIIQRQQATPTGFLRQSGPSLRSRPAWRVRQPVLSGSAFTRRQAQDAGSLWAQMSATHPAILFISLGVAPPLWANPQTSPRSRAEQGPRARI